MTHNEIPEEELLNNLPVLRHLFKAADLQKEALENLHAFIKDVEEYRK